MPVELRQAEKEGHSAELWRRFSQSFQCRSSISIPKWLEILPQDHWLKAHVIQAVKEILKKTSHMKDVQGELLTAPDESIRRMKVTGMKMADGSVSVEIDVDDGCYYQI